MRIRFGDVVFDNETRQLSRNGEPVHLSPKAFELLEILIQDRPRAMSKKELIDRLWRDVIVEEENLKARIREIRVVIGKQWVRTVHRFGYAFQGQPEEETAGEEPPLYWIDCGGKAFPLRRGESYIGRDPHCNIWIDDVSISRKHARIVVAEDRVTIEDLGSKNGTALGKIPVTGTAELCVGDRIRLGSVKLLFRAAASLESTRTTPSGD